MRSDEGFEPTLRKLVSLLDRFSVRFHLTGGIASVAYGEPRLTQDIDLVVDAERLIAVESFDRYSAVRAPTSWPS